LLLQWRGVGVISHDPRATTTELQKRSSKTGNRKRSGESQNVCGRRGNGRTEMGKNWTKGKGKNSQRKYGKQHRTGNGENITEIQTIPKRYTSEGKEPEMELT